MKKQKNISIFSFFLLLFIIPLLSLAELDDLNVIEQEQIVYSVGYLEDTPNSFFSNLSSLDFENIPSRTYDLEFSNINEIENSIYADARFLRTEKNETIIEHLNITNRIIWIYNSENQWIEYAHLLDNETNYNASYNPITEFFTLSVLYEERFEIVTVDTNYGITTFIEILPLDLDENKSLWIELRNFPPTNSNNNHEKNWNIRNLILISIALLILSVPIFYSIYRITKYLR